MRTVFATGGSGGHIFPALKTAEFLREQGHEILFIGALSSVEERLKGSKWDFRILDVEGFNIRSIPRFMIRMTRAVSESKELLSQIRPDVVVGFGSYSSFPVLWAAKKLKVPTMIHEQNVIPGKANRLASKFVSRIAVSFDETRRFLGQKKTVWTGCPCNDRRPEGSREQILKSYGLLQGRRTILVLGGSQGSRYLNEIFFECIPKLGDVQVIHMTGMTDELLYREKYRSLGIAYHLRPFIENIERAYAVADIVIARAGAATVCELASFALPSILVPYPFAHSHQTANAQVLEKAGVARIIDQKDLGPQSLLAAFDQMTGLHLTPAVLRQKLEGVFLNNPTQRLAEAIVAMNA